MGIFDKFFSTPQEAAAFFNGVLVGTVYMLVASLICLYFAWRNSK